MRKNIAHKENNILQTVEEHLTGTAELAETFASKIGLSKTGYLAGLLHDLGKCSDKFYDRIMNNGPICDHSTAGAEYATLLFKNLNIKYKQILLSVLQFSILSHHGGLIDEVDDDGMAERTRRLKSDVGLSNVLDKADKSILDKAKKVCQKDLNNEFQNVIYLINQRYKTKLAFYFNLSLLIKFLFSCLVDADRKNTIRFFNQAKNQKNLKLLIIVDN